MGCQTADMKAKMFGQYHKVFKINPKDIHKRELVASIELKEGRRPSYMHQNAPTENHYTIVGQPLYMDIERVMFGASLAEGGLVSPADDTTIFQIVKLSDGSVRSIEVPGFLIGHVINSYEDGDDIVLDVTWYNATSGGFFTRYLLGNIRNKSKRDAFPKSKVVRFRLKADGTAEQTNTLALSTPDADVELPAVNPNNEGKKYCVIWGVEFSAGGRSFASTALMKRNICTGEAVSVFEEGVYVSEHRFIPRPGATEEDDGTLVGLVFDSRKGESAMHVRDGKTLELLASAWMALKVPFPVHATWFGENAQTAIVV
jgi:carotenoid cleavage dioxygenase-like enzyme